MSNILPQLLALCRVTNCFYQLALALFSVPFLAEKKVLYSKLNVLAFAIASAAVVVCALVITGTQWRSYGENG